MINLQRQVGCAAQKAQTVVHRQPLERLLREYRTPTKYKLRVRDYDPRTGDPITYDHKPRIEVIDVQARKYAFKWIGFDGLEKTATFQSGDAVDVMVSATVSSMESAKYLYSYDVKNLPSSGANLKRFVVQTFASDVKPEKGGALFPGFFSQEIPSFSQGKWLDFADARYYEQIYPGQAVTVHLTSSAPPGLVECRASAETVVEGADEDTPEDLDSLLIGFDEYPHGYTIGPVEALDNRNAGERTKYLLDKLPAFRRAGWIAEDAANQYEQYLRNGDLQSVRRRIEQDLKAQQIAREVYGIIDAMK